mgnify:CR=1 FL=1
MSLRVIVVGAGFGGIGAAKELGDAGHDVLNDQGLVIDENQRLTPQKTEDQKSEEEIKAERQKAKDAEDDKAREGFEAAAPAAA